MSKKRFKFKWLTRDEFEKLSNEDWVMDKHIRQQKREYKQRRHKIFTNKYKLYVYAKADQMIDHDFTDDVAMVAARNIKDALKLFLDLYGEADIDHIAEYKINPEHVYILTDY